MAKRFVTPHLALQAMQSGRKDATLDAYPQETIVSWNARREAGGLLKIAVVGCNSLLVKRN